MFKNYFKIAWRNLFRNKGFSLTNLLGLSIGMTCTIFIFLWAYESRNNETNFIFLLYLGMKLLYTILLPSQQGLHAWLMSTG